MGMTIAPIKLSLNYKIHFDINTNTLAWIAGTKIEIDELNGAAYYDVRRDGIAGRNNII